MLDPDQVTYLTETVALMRALGVVTWNEITILEKAPRAVPPEEHVEQPETPAETMAAKKRRLFTAAAK